jgi:hypothetical protein
MPFATPPLCRGIIFPLICIIIPNVSRSWQWGKARECYQRGIDVDNLAEEFYQSLMIVS